MKRVIYSQSFDSLAECLSQELVQNQKSPFSPQTILVPEGPMGSWLSQKLADSLKERALFGLSFLSLEKWLYTKLKSFPTKLDLLFSLYLALGEKYKEEKKRGELAHHLSGLFSEYGKWGPLQPPNWQTELFDFPSSSFETTSPLYCFGIDFFPPLYWDLFEKVQKLSFYLFSPCLLFWEDITSPFETARLVNHWRKKNANPAQLNDLASYLKEAPSLLASLGTLARKTSKKISNWDVETVDAYDLFPPKTSLETLQNALLHFETSPPHSDGSIRCLATGSSRYFEVETLCEEILILAKKGAKFCDISVLISDLDLYAPIVELLFSKYGIPFRIFGVEFREKSLALQGFSRLLKALHSMSIEDLSLLFESASFLDKIDASNQEVFASWVQKSEDSLIDGLLFFDSPEISSLEDLNVFLERISSLKKDREELQKDRSPADWAHFFLSLREKYLLFSEKEELEKQATSALLAIFHRLQKTSCQEKVPFSLVEKTLHCHSSIYLHGNELHSVLISSLSEGATLPCKHLFLVGMDEDSFPRKEISSSLDLLRNKKPRKAELDRALFLRSLFCAKSSLTITYGHLSKEDGKPLDVSPIVQEILPFSMQEERKIVSTQTPFITSIDLKKPPTEIAFQKELVVSLQDLSLLAKNPWKFFLKKELGVHIDSFQPESFALQKHLLLKKDQEISLKGMMKEALQKEVDATQASWSRTLHSWGISEPLSTFSLLESAREKTETEGPPLIVTVKENVRIKIVGELSSISSLGLVFFGKDSMETILRIWPDWLVFSCLFNLSTLFCVKSEKTKIIAHPQKALSRYLTYFLSAQKSASPLLPEWIDPILRKRMDILEKRRAALLSKRSFGYQDPATEWLLQRALIPTAEEIEALWGDFLRETFEDLIGL